METQDRGISTAERRRWSEIITAKRAPKTAEIYDSPFAAALLAFRCDHKLTMTELAARLGVPYRTYQSWETGEYKCQHPRTVLLALRSVSADLYS